MSFKTIAQIVKKIQSSDKSFYRVILEEDMKDRQVTEEQSLNEMRYIYQNMKNADNNYDENILSASKLVGKEGQKIHEAIKEDRLTCGNFIGKVMERAIKMGESNACMKKIVAAPTAGSCGVIPAVLLTYEEEYNISEDKIIEALYVSSGIGSIIALNASISGAMGGCQAEIGSASSMAAGALAYLKGGSYNEIVNAGAMALKALLGLVCDPVAGLVEVPCVKRNVIGAVNAVTSADMACCYIESKIPFDEVIYAMKDIGDMMDSRLKETSSGGLATTQTALRIVKDITKNNKN